MKLSRTKPNRILLVYPKIPQNTFWSYSHSLPFVNKKSSLPPLGLITLASLFPPQYELKLIDMNVETLKDKDLKWADAVFISAMIVQRESFLRVVERCKQFSLIIVAGGPYPTSSWEEIKDIDHFILGEGRILKNTSGNNTHCLETNFITSMDKTQLIKGYQKVLDTIYDKRLKTYFDRCNRLLDNIGEQLFFNREVHWAEIKMGIKSLIRQPLTSYGYQYLKFLGRNLLN